MDILRQPGNQGRMTLQGSLLECDDVVVIFVFETLSRF